jgi:hypothetical protein
MEFIDFRKIRYSYSYYSRQNNTIASSCELFMSVYRLIMQLKENYSIRKLQCWVCNNRDLDFAEQTLEHY